MASRACRGLVGLWRGLRLKRLFKALLHWTPPGCERWMRRQMVKAMVMSGYHRLVPERELEAKYREAWEWLLAGRDRSAVGDYLEFGVCHGSAMACMHRVLRSLGLNQVRLFGFDSFEGLPEPGQGESRVWKKGSFQSDERFTRKFLSAAGVDWSRVVLIKGWFTQTLNQGLVRKYRLAQAGVVLIDCDLYASAKTALSFCAPLIRDRAVILFDDWYVGDLAEKSLGEKKAFLEFLQEHPEFTATEFGQYNHNSQVFKITRGAPGEARAVTMGEATEAALSTLP